MFVVLSHTGTPIYPKLRPSEPDSAAGGLRCLRPLLSWFRVGVCRGRFALVI
jgi:hypothetical protein